jgi:hypothetical protein
VVLVLRLERGAFLDFRHEVLLLYL